MSVTSHVWYAIALSMEIPVQADERRHFKMFSFFCNWAIFSHMPDAASSCIVLWPWPHHVENLDQVVLLFVDLVIWKVM